MSYDGRVVLGESVDKLLIQSQINSFGDLVHDHWIKYSEHFKKSEERLTKSLNAWLFNFFGEWELRDLNWLYEINDIENGAELCGNRCHGERFSFTFRNTDVYSEIILSFTDLSSEMGLEPFSQLEFESIQIEVKIYRLHSDTLFADIMDLSKTNDFVEFLKLNFESFKKSLVDEYTELDQKCIQYSDDVDVLYEALLAKNERLRSLESSIEKLNSTVADQKDDWIAFKSRNEDYYLAATNYLESITDSTLKEEIAQQIEGSQDRYKSKRDQGEDKWSKLSNQINQLRNNQIALKITLTIPIIESYQGAKSESVVDLKPLIDAQVEIVSEMEELLELT